MKISNVEKFFTDGDEYYEDVYNQIKQAQKEIIIESYIYEFDDIGKGILRLLSEAVKNKIKVYLIVDAVGSVFSLRQLINYCKNEQIPLGIYKPLPMQIGHFKFAHVLFLLRFRSFAYWFNKRNHRKLIIIDRASAYLGSFNISNAHSKKYSGSNTWQDLGAKISGESISILTHAVARSWKKSRKPGVSQPLKAKLKFEFLNKTDIKLNYKLSFKFQMRRFLKKSLKRAVNKIYIANAYFLPNRSIVRRLRRAAERGVDVKIIVPQQTDVRLVRWASYHLYKKLIRSGIKIYEFQNRMFHSKYWLIDNTASLGSHNFNHRSLFHDLEVELTLSKPEHIEQIESFWKADLLNCKEISINDINKIPLITRLFYNFIYLFRYWL